MFYKQKSQQKRQERERKEVCWLSRCLAWVVESLYCAGSYFRTHMAYHAVHVPLHLPLSPVQRAVVEIDRSEHRKISAILKEVKEGGEPSRSTSSEGAVALPPDLPTM